MGSGQCQAPVHARGLISTSRVESNPRFGFADACRNRLHVCAGVRQTEGCGRNGKRQHFQDVCRALFGQETSGLATQPCDGSLVGPWFGTGGALVQIQSPPTNSFNEAVSRSAEKSTVVEFVDGHILRVQQVGESRRV